MLVISYVVSPKRGSLLLLRMVICRSDEYQRSDTTWIGRSLPISPAGIVKLVRDPFACTPFTLCVPRSSVVGSVLFACPPVEKNRTSPPARANWVLAVMRTSGPPGAAPAAE